MNDKNEAMSLTQNLQDLSNFIKGGLEGTEVNFNLSPNSKNSKISPKVTFPEISASNFHKLNQQLGLNNEDTQDLDPVQEDYYHEKYETNMEENEFENTDTNGMNSELVTFQKYENLGNELELIYKEKYVNLETKNRELYVKNMDMVEKITELTDFIDQLKEENLTYRQDQEQNTQKETTRVHQITQLKMDITNLVEQNQMLKQSRNEGGDLIEGLKQENYELQTKLESVYDDIENYKSNYLSKELHESELEKAFESQKIRDELRLALEKVQQEKASLQNLMRDLEFEKESLNSQVESIGNKMDETIKENDELRQQLVSNRQELGKMSTIELTANEHLARIEELERCIDDRNLKIKQTNIKLENYEMEMTSALDKINTLKNMNDTYSKNMQNTEIEKRQVIYPIQN